MGPRLPRRRDPRHRRRDAVRAGVGVVDRRSVDTATARLTRPRPPRARRLARDPRVAGAGDRRAPLPPPDGRGGRDHGAPRSSSSRRPACGTRCREARGVVLVDSITAWSVAPWLMAGSAERAGPVAAILHQPPGGVGQGAVRTALQRPLDQAALPALRPADRGQHGARPRARRRLRPPRRAGLRGRARQ